MAITPQFIDERFNPLIKNVLKKIVKNWSKSFQATLAQFRESTQNLQGVLDNLAVDEISPFQFRSQLEKTFNEYLGWTTDLNFASDNIFSNQFLETWDSEFKQSLEELPKKMNITIKDGFWETQKEDNLKIRLWKWKKRRQIGLKKIQLNVRNKTRAIFKKSQIPIPKISRKFSLHDFLTYYLNQPYIDFLLQEWQRFLQLAANQLYQCHTQSEAIKNNSLFHGESIASCLTPDSGELLAQIEKIKQQIIDLIQLFDDTDQFNEQAIIRLESAWSEIVNGIEQKWEPAGTLALSSRRFGSKKIESNKNRLHKKFENIKDSWLKHFFGEKEEWQKDIELSLIQLQTSRICNDTILEVEKKISLDIVPLFAETGELIASHLNKFKLISPDKKSEIRKAIATENRLLVEKLRREKLPVILDALLEAGFDSVLKNYLDQTRKGLEIFSERHLIFRNRDMENLTPKSTTVEVPFRLLILEEIFPSLQTAHETLIGETHRQMEELLRDVSEIDQIVEYNLETALNLLQERKDVDTVTDASNVAIEGLERSIQKIEELIDKNKKIGDQIRESLFQTSFDYVRQIQDLADNEKVNQLQLRFAKAKVKEKLRNYQVRLWNKLKTGFFHVKEWSLQLFQQVLTQYFRIRKIAGLAPTEQEVEVKLTTFLTDNQKRIASLPFVYNRLFRKEPISDERFFAGRTKELLELENAFTEWQSGQYGVTAVVGEKGSGKTTLLNLAEQKFLHNIPIIKINLAEITITRDEKLLELLAQSFDEKKAKTLEELENRLKDAPERRICIFENIQNLFLRVVDGFDALERFLLFISRTDKAIFWLMSCTVYSWHYLDKVTQISKFCKSTINLAGMEQSDVENIILKRHRISGYQLHFDLPKLVDQSRQFRKLNNEEQQQTFLKNMYFDQLNKLSAGNITVALSFWLSAIRNISENKMTLWPSIDLDYSFLHQLAPDELFTLAALVQHETMDAEEHAVVFHQGVQQSLLLLTRLKNKRIIVDIENRFQIHHLLYRPVIAVLKTKNIIH